LNLSSDWFNESGTPEFNLWRVANTSGGKYYYSSDSTELNGIYQTILREIIEEVEIERSARLARGKTLIFSDGFESGFGFIWTAGAGWSISASQY
jgi:hypothetical protein